MAQREVAARFRSAKRYKQFIDGIESDFGNLRFSRVHSPEFNSNLKHFGGDDFPAFLASLVLQKYRLGKTVPIRELVLTLVPDKDLSKKEYHLRNFLKASALGMVPG